MIYTPTDDFYVQRLEITNIKESRFDFLATLCKDKKVMHIGCAEVPTYRKDSNLHIALSKLSNLHGMDINMEGIQALQKDCPGTYYTSFEEIKERYDMVLVPEVMEHVLNVGLFLQDIFSIQSKEYFITAPSINNGQIICLDTYCIEGIHPDHKYWFSPYTLYNVVKPFSGGYQMKLYYLENRSQVGIWLYK